MRRNSLKTILTATYILIGLIPLTILAFVSFEHSSSEIKKQSFQQLTAVNAIKKSTISNYFQNISDQVETFSADLMVVEAMRDFIEGHDSYLVEQNIDVKRVASMRNELEGYYIDEFEAEFKEQN